MSREGAPQAIEKAARKDLIARLRVLKPGPQDVIYLELPQRYFEDEDALAGAKAFSQEVSKVTGGRPVFMVTQGQEKLSSGPPPRQPDIAIPPPGILLPPGVRT